MAQWFLQVIRRFPRDLSTTELLGFSSQVFNSFNVSGGQIVGGGFAAQNIGEGVTVIIRNAASITVDSVVYNNALSLDNQTTVVGNSDGGFAGTTFTPAAVPDARSALALFGAALFGLAFVRRKVLSK